MTTTATREPPFYSADEIWSGKDAPRFHADYFKTEDQARAWAGEYGGHVAAIPNSGPTFWRVRRLKSKG